MHPIVCTNSLIRLRETYGNTVQLADVQREKGRRGCMGSLDLKLAKVEERRYKRQLEIDSRRKKEQERVVRPIDIDCDNFHDIAGTSTDSSATEDEGVSTTKSFAKTPKRIKTVRPTNIISFTRLPIT